MTTGFDGAFRDAKHGRCFPYRQALGFSQQESGALIDRDPCQGFREHDRVVDRELRPFGITRGQQPREHLAPTML
jgi:hypothetical protein